MVLSTNAIAQLVWTAPILISDSGDVVGVDLSVVGYDSLISSQGTIQFDETILEYSHVDNFALTSMSSGSFGETEVTDGLLTFSWYESSLVGQGIPDNDVVFTMYFTVIGSSEEVSLIELIDQPVVAEFVDEAFITVPFTYETGSVTVSGISSMEEIDLLNQISIYPNPACELINIRSFSAIGSVFELEWFSMSGDLIKKDVFYNMGGVNIVSTEGLSHGVYHVRIGNSIAGFDNQLIQIL